MVEAVWFPKVRSASRSARRRRSRTSGARPSRTRSHILALSFSASFPLRQAVDGLDTLRRELPAQVTIWAGGEMTRRVRKTIPASC